MSTVASVGATVANLAQHVAQARAFAHDVFETMVEIDLVFEILLFLGQTIAQFRDLFEGQSVVHRHGHLSRHLSQHVGIVL